jgi:hypothetical protein
VVDPPIAPAREEDRVLIRPLGSLFFVYCLLVPS